jgi:chorismate mutase
MLYKGLKNCDGNPVNPDSLWLGGERLYNAGIEKLGVIIEVFYLRKNYRNIPEWQIAIELQNNFLIYL